MKTGRRIQCRSKGNEKQRAVLLRFHASQVGEWSLLLFE
jgi:hypothetical protein